MCKTGRTQLILLSVMLALAFMTTVALAAEEGGTPDFTFDAGTGTLTAHTNQGTIAWRQNGVLVSDVVHVVVDDGVRSIAEQAFSSCVNLKSATLGGSVETIGMGAFWGCEKLTGIDMPDSVTTIGGSAFLGCTDLARVTLGNGLETIGMNAFRACGGFTSIKIPDSVRTIGSSAFGAASGLTSLTIPDGVTSIGDEAIFACTALTSVTLGKSVETIGNMAFANCTALTDIVIPDSVRAIGEGIFASCTKLTNVTLGRGLETIGASAFYNCKSLTEIEIPDSVKTIGALAFFKLPNLVSVSIGSGLKEIGNELFSHCKKLRSVTIGENVEIIGIQAFFECSSLTKIIIPSSVKIIGDEAFWHCTALTDITMGNSVELIDYNAFRGCTGLTAFNIPASVKTIRNYAFNSCGRLNAITFEGIEPPPELSPKAFLSVPGTGVIYCPAGSVDAYRTVLSQTDLKGWRFNEAESDDQVVQDAIETLDRLNVSLNAKSANTQEDAVAQLPKMLNAALAPAYIIVGRADIEISNFEEATNEADGSFDYSANLKKGMAEGTVRGKASIRFAPRNGTLSATAASGFYDNAKPKSKDSRWSFDLADGKARFSAVGKVVMNWTSSKPKLVSIDRVTGEAALLKQGKNIVITAHLSDGTKLSQRINAVNMAREVKLQWKKGGKWVDFAVEAPSVAVGKKLSVRATSVTPSASAEMLGFAWTLGDGGIATGSLKPTRTNVLKAQAAGRTSVTVTLFGGVTATGNLDVIHQKDASERVIEVPTVGEADEAA